MGRKFGWHSGKLICKDLDVQNTINLGTLDFGAAELDSIVIKGRMATSTVAGANLNLGADYAYGELTEFRCNVTGWARNFIGYYYRTATSTKTTSYNLTGMSVVTSSDKSVVGLMAFYSEASAKTVDTDSTWASVYSNEANVSLYAQTSTVVVTEASCYRGTMRINSGYDAYTGLHGLIIETGDGSTATRTLGSGIVLRNVSPAEGTQSWTKGVQIAMGCTTGISIEGTTATGINLAGACTVAAISMNSATFAAGDNEIEMRNSVTNEKTIISSGSASNDGEIVTAVGADAGIADGSLYLSTAGGGVLYIKKSDVWTAYTNP